MRYWRVLVKPGDGTQFFTRAVEISAHRAILRGSQALPAGVVFASGDIRLEFRVKSLSDEAQQLIDSRRLG